MSVLLTWARIASVAIRPVLFSGDQEGTLGGPSLHIPRMGDRFAADIVTTQFQQDAQSRVFMADLFEATTHDARIALRQPNAGSGAAVAGNPVVDGTDQSGTTLAVRGLFPHQALSRGDFFNVIHAGLRYLYMVAGAGQVLADASGHAAVPIWPMLRFLTVDGAACVFGDVMIEGRLSGFDKGATFVRNRVEPMQFTIGERA